MIRGIVRRSLSASREDSMSPIDTTVIPRLGPETAGLTLSPEEFDSAVDYDDNCNYELIRGVLVVTPLAGEAERSPNELLGNWLWFYQQHHPQGALLVETLFEQCLKTAENRRRADRVIWTVVNHHRPDPRLELPSIVVEFVSAGKAAWRRDYHEKRDEYLAAGILEYWVFDRFARSLTVYSRRDGQTVEQTITEEETFRPVLLPGFELPLAKLLAAADRWSDPT
jgi:Uma2 family endonuclease